MVGEKNKRDEIGRMHRINIKREVTWERVKKPIGHERPRLMNFKCVPVFGPRERERESERLLVPVPGA